MVFEEKSCSQKSSSPKSLEIETKAQKKKAKKEEKKNKKLLFMTFYLSIFSAANNLVAFSAQFVIFVFALSPSIEAWLVFIYPFSFTLKNFMNILFFFRYNHQFRNSQLFLNKPTLENGPSTNRIQVKKMLSLYSCLFNLKESLII